MKSELVFLIGIFLIVSTFAVPPTKSYRKDYVYNFKTDAFYKFHIETAVRSHAAELCQLEGATLMVPSSQEDFKQAHEMMKQFPDLGDLAWIGDDGVRHDSVEVTPIIDLTPQEDENIGYITNCEVIDREGAIKTVSCYSSLLPFICKVAAKDVPYDERCGLHGNAYKYLESTNSCYRVPLVALKWNGAYAECDNEYAHLIILNSVAEHRAIKEFLKTAPRLISAKVPYFYFAGLRAEKEEKVEGATNTRVFRTIFNETLEEAGYSKWSEGEPNNHQSSEYCGSIFSNDGKYNDLNCNMKFAFICEKEVK